MNGVGIEAHLQDKLGALLLHFTGWRLGLIGQVIGEFRLLEDRLSRAGINTVLTTQR